MDENTTPIIRLRFPVDLGDFEALRVVVIQGSPYNPIILASRDYERPTGHTLELTLTQEETLYAAGLATIEVRGKYKLSGQIVRFRHKNIYVGETYDKRVM